MTKIEELNYFVAFEVKDDNYSAYFVNQSNAPIRVKLSSTGFLAMKIMRIRHPPP
jgi:hypothetical protein